MATSFRLTPACLALVLIVSACSEQKDLPSVVTDGDGFFGSPWPSDTRTRNGRPDMTGFPKRDEPGLVADYADMIESLDGFGTHAPIYVPVNRSIDDLPSPGDTQTIEGPIVLIDIDPDSPDRGAVIPVDVSQQEADTLWQRENLLNIQPVWGYPLRPGTTYALLLSDSFVRSDPNWKVDQDWTDLKNTLLALRWDLANVAYAVQITTQDPVTEMAKFAARIRGDLTLPALDQDLSQTQVADNYKAFRGEMWVPIWQHGSKPFLVEGGGFRFDEDGMPILASWERARFTLSLPRDHSMPTGGWPIVIYGHGTGGDHESFISTGTHISPASKLASAGIAGFSISLPLHGDRGTVIDPALASFNYLNPESARSCFRQGALDQIYIAEVLTRFSHQFDTAQGPIETDPDRVAYMGHSHGGLIGAIATPFFNDTISAVFFSGAGGGLSTTLVSRDAGDFDIQGILESALDFDENDILTETHPVVGLVQTLAETTDPINYAPYWFSRKPNWKSQPRSVLMTEGMFDLQTPPDTAEALAAAGRLPVLSPAVHLSTAHSLFKNSVDTMPAMSNKESYDQSQVTAGLVQFSEDDHFAIFRNDEAADLYLNFLATALEDGRPWISEP